MSDIAAVLAGESRYHVAHCTAAELADALPDGCANLIATDPPYNAVKGAAWDNQWPSDADFLAWLGSHLEQWQRVLAGNGSLYWFASPQMGARVECEVRKWFEVLTNIRWCKPSHSTKAEMFRKEDLRAPFPSSETIIFAEQFSADNRALGESGYVQACDELRGFVFEPLRAYLDGERKRAGLSSSAIRDGMHELTGKRYVLERHAFSASQWELPTADQYGALGVLLGRDGNRDGAPYCERSHEDLRTQYEELRTQYEELRTQYEELRRPFNASPERPYTDTWPFETVAAYPGKHECEKPEAMARHIIETSSRPGDLVVDFFSGSGVFAATAVAMERRAIACDFDPHWAEMSWRRCATAAAGGPVAVRRIVQSDPRQVPLPI